MGREEESCWEERAGRGEEDDQNIFYSFLKNKIEIVKKNNNVFGG